MREPKDYELNIAIVNVKLELQRAEATVSSIKEYLFNLERQLQLINALNSKD